MFKLIRVPVRVKRSASIAFQRSNGEMDQQETEQQLVSGLRLLQVSEVRFEGRAILVLGLQFRLQLFHQKL
jgi:hypothetical protein